MVKIKTQTARLSFVVGIVALLVAACETLPSFPGMNNLPPKTETVPRLANPRLANSGVANSGVANSGVAKSGLENPAVGNDKPDPAAVEVARVYPQRPRLQTGLRPALKQYVDPRPPMLPSLEELLGRMPQANTGQSFREPPPVPATRGRRVAILLPLTGANQRIGQALLSAAQMALFEFADHNFELLVHDTHGTSEGAREAVRLAIADGASLVVGPLLASSVRAVSPLAKAAGVPVMAFSSDRTVVGGGVYTMGFFPGDEVRRVVRFARKKGAVRFALLAPRGAYGQTVLQALQTEVEALSGIVTQVQLYAPGETDFSAPVKQLANYDMRRKDLLDQRKILEERNDDFGELALKRLENFQTLGDPPFDALLVADGGKRLVAVAALLPFYDIDPKKVMILGTGQWDEQGLGTEPALLGGWFAAPDPARRQAFSDKYFDAFGIRPHRLATLAYDATALAVVLGAQDRARVYAQNIMMDPTGFTGRDGIFRFGYDGAVERGLAVMQVQRKDAKVIDPAPSAFVN
ncbi:MAG: penicillin-binding protein activator [Magnetovibrio sp.]|nr:penicillin-binding protein activator [Magnetovibrio sp.]